MIKSFRDLEIYEESYQLMIEIHQHINRLPYFERMELPSQIRHASKSIPTNIAEGWAKHHNTKDFKRYLDIALGSTNEMEVHLETVKDLKYLGQEVCINLLKRYKFLGGKIVRLKQIWRSF